MQIYKLFYKNPNLKDISKIVGGAPVIIGKSSESFGVRVDPEHYREFINGISKHLKNAKIKQHIMTDFKFIELIKRMETLNICVKDINFYDADQLQDDEIVQELKSALWKESNNEIKELIIEAVEAGMKIQSIIVYLDKGDQSQERVGIFSNGTITIENSSTLKKENLRIIDFLVKGPTAI
ncbi:MULTISPECIES: hypothetical protein [Lysinibacillus]|uniref:hypothetical protein n=1 Tax=Lysinibacillus TaxID=400634 RepID=UPI0021624416|nr:hypothetical protein [Lysinibacillus boronitolerans]MCS1390626.1 hypothetical protein [Lysinibacillus boronitolerans]